jgi:hypothetical protein
MKKVSYSQYTMWANCPHAWRLKYVEGHRFDDSSIHTIFGTCMHEVIQEWLDILYNKSETLAKTVFLHDKFKDRLLQLFKENVLLNEHGEKTFLADKKTLMEFYEQGCQILTHTQNNYKKLFPTENTKLFAIEYPLDIEVRPGVHYIGFIDIVTYNEKTGQYVLYDLKTSKSGWSPQQKKDPLKTGQLLLYKRFFAKQLNINEKDIDVEFIMLKRIVPDTTQFVIPRVSKFEPSNGTPSVNKAWQSFEEFLNTAFDSAGNYVADQRAAPSADTCRWCVYRDKKDLCAVGVVKK